MSKEQQEAERLIKEFHRLMTGPGIEANKRNAPGIAAKCVKEILEAIYQHQVGGMDVADWNKVLNHITHE